MKDYGLAGKIALVTGGGRGIGRAIAEGFAQEGAKVVIADRNQANGRDVVQAIGGTGGQAIFVDCDVSDAASVDAMMSATIDSFGRLDCACNAAGIDRELGEMADQSDDMFDTIMAVNLRGIFLSMKREINQMLKQGHGGTIVNVLSTCSFRPTPTTAVYSASKAAAYSLTKSAAVSYAARDIRINSVAPGLIDTPLSRESLARNGSEVADFIPAISLNGRFGRPEEVAEAVLWLSSDLATNCYGHALAVDSGYLSR